MAEETKLDMLVALCQFLEPKVRELGWHVAATGSALYGHPEDPLRDVEDIDVLLYRHHGWTKTQTAWRPFDVLLSTGLRKLEDCTEYPEFMSEPQGAMGAKEKNNRKVFRWRSPNGLKVDFLCIDELC